MFRTTKAQESDIYEKRARYKEIAKRYGTVICDLMLELMPDSNKSWKRSSKEIADECFRKAHQFEKLYDICHKGKEAEAAREQEKVERTCINDSRLLYYGYPVTCLNGDKVSVRDSSPSENHTCWLSIDDSACSTPNNMSAHLDVDMARAVINRLQAFVNTADGQ